MLIIADDLSGAADCAVAGVRAGLESVVFLDDAAGGSAQVVAIDANTRCRSPLESRAVNAALWRTHAAPGRLFYKKIDSTLRGHVASDVAVFVDAGVAVVAPAFPRGGRTTRRGRVFVDGDPLESTEIWSNERMRGEADVVSMLHAEGVSAINIPLATVRADLRGALERVVGGGNVQAVVCDAETDGDLAVIARASIDLPVYWVGSAGLAAHLPGAAGLTGGAPPPRLAVAGPIVTVVGSRSSVSRAQAARLEEHARVASFTGTADLLREAEAHPSWQGLREELGRALSEGTDVLLRIADEGRDDGADGRVLCESLGRLLSPLARTIGAFVATGGETARSVLSATGACGLRLVRELEPGIPLSVMLGRLAVPVVTKAGAFGSPGSLLHCYQELAAVRHATGAANEDR